MFFSLCCQTTPKLYEISPMSTHTKAFTCHQIKQKTIRERWTKAAHCNNLPILDPQGLTKISDGESKLELKLNLPEMEFLELDFSLGTELVCFCVL